MGVTAEHQWQTDTQGNLVMPELQSEYLDWLLTSEREREPRTEGQWCGINGVAPATVRKWRQDRRFREIWERRAQERLIAPERLQAVMDVLYNSAVETGDVGAAKQFLLEAQKIAPPQEVKRDASVSHMTDEQLVTEIRMLLDRGLG